MATGNIDTSTIGTERIASEIESFVSILDLKRKPWERRWYDNKFFDDGYHFKFISRTTGKIIDASTGKNTLGPSRSIPKASRQIRAVANLLMGAEPFPVVYPEKINPNLYGKVMNPETKKEEFSSDYIAARKAAKEIAQNIGHWITKEWERQNLEDKLTLMIILAATYGVSYIQVWPDALEEQIKTAIWDAFDIYCIGELNDLEDSPMIVKATPKLISQLKANEEFDEAQLKKISPDNRYASSEIKEAYMRSRFGKGMPNDTSATLIQKEAFIKEYVNAENREQIISDLGKRAGEFKMGDVIIRQVFECAGIWLKDKYTTLRKYPIVPFVMEPGPLYQVPLIERFIPANKSLDVVMSRVERYINTMVAGSWAVMKGENFQITNKAGGNILEYETRKPEQVEIAPLPNAVFNYIQELNSNIEEQGASVSGLNQLPEGVKAGVAIESLKATEYANLKIPSKQLKLTVKKITERMIEIAGNHFVTPQAVQYFDKDNEPSYFDIIGEEGIKARQGANIETDPSIIVIHPDTVVDIEVETGIGFTEQGRRDTMMQIANYMLSMVQQQILPIEAVQVAVKELLETFQFGSTQEFMQAIEEGTMPQDFTQDQLQKLKIAMLETMKDVGMAGPEADAKLVDSTKVGVLEALKQSGLAEKIQGTVPDNPELDAIPYKDAPPSIQRQMEQRAGLTPATEPSPSEIESVNKVMSVANANKQTENSMVQADRSHEVAMKQMDDKMKMKPKGGETK